MRNIDFGKEHKDVKREWCAPPSFLCQLVERMLKDKDSGMSPPEFAPCQYKG